MKFTGTDQEVYNSFHDSAKKNIEASKGEIRRYFYNKSKKELENYKEVIFVEHERQSLEENFFTNAWYSIFVPAIISSVITLYGFIITEFKLNLSDEIKVNIPLIIVGIALVLIVIVYTVKHRPNSRKQIEQTKLKKLLYFLEHYSK